jgi:hypothetical protein
MSKATDLTEFIMVGGTVTKDSIVEYRKEYVTGSEQYPELDKLASDLAHVVSKEINKRVRSVESKMPYKAQYVLENLIEHLKEMV